MLHRQQDLCEVCHPLGVVLRGGTLTRHEGFRAEGLPPISGPPCREPLVRQPVGDGSGGPGAAPLRPVSAILPGWSSGAAPSVVLPWG